MAEFHKSSTFFTAFRKEFGFPLFYREQPLDWLVETGIWGFSVAYIAAVLTVTVLIALLGTRGYSRWRVTLQMIISLGIGLSIIICVTGTFWRIDEYTTQEGNDTVKYTINVGLSGANVTMGRMSENNTVRTELHNLRIGWWEVSQAEEEYREALMRGWPIGILKIARYLSVDMGGMRYMRAFRSSGYAVWVLLWAAFAVWILSNALIGSNIRYAALFLLSTGLLQLLAVIVYTNRQPQNFFIQIDDGQNTRLRLRYDWMYWVTLFIGIFTMLISAIMLVLDYLRPADMNKFFGTQAEIHSPYEEELLMNRNKDIKGMIRSLSQKRSVGKSPALLSREGEETERHRKSPLTQTYHNFGAVNSGFSHSMSSIQEDYHSHAGKTQTASGSHLLVPDIQVEMANIRSETSRLANNNGAEEQSDNAQPQSHQNSPVKPSSPDIAVDSDESETSLGGDGHASNTLRSRISVPSNTARTQDLIITEKH